MVKDIHFRELYVTRLQGQVSLESSAGQGSTFWFTLRASDETPS